MNSNTYSFIAEIPAGSYFKYEYDADDHLTVKRQHILPCPLTYGFIQELKGEDDDRLDCFLCLETFTEVLPSGTIIEVRIEGSFELVDETGACETKVIATPLFQEDDRIFNSSFSVKDLLDPDTKQLLPSINKVQGLYDFVINCKSYKIGINRKIQNLLDKEETLQKLEILKHDRPTNR